MSAEPTTMTEHERLLHYVLGIVQGKITPADTENPLREAFDEYIRLGYDPLAKEWPVLTLSPPLPDEVLAATRSSYEALKAHVEEHGMTPEARGALVGMARLLGEKPPPAARQIPKSPEERTAADIDPASLIADDEQDMCLRCRIMDDVAVPLGEKDGKPWCERCNTDGSGRGLNG